MRHGESGEQPSGAEVSVRRIAARGSTAHQRMDWLLAKLAEVLADAGNSVPDPNDTTTDVDAGEIIDRIQLMEQLSAQLAGAIAEESLAFARVERRRQLAAGVRSRDLGRGTAEQIGYARRMSPVAATRDLAVAATVRQRFPLVYSELRAGAVSWRQCQIVVRETSHVDDALAALADNGLKEALPGWNLRQTERGVRQAVYELDPRGAVDRRGRAESERRVTIRPMPDTMTMVSALLPVAEGVATHAWLSRAAETARAAGDPRTKDQLMADLLVQRLLGGGESDTATGFTPDAAAGHADRCDPDTETPCSAAHQTGDRRAGTNPHAAGEVGADPAAEASGVGVLLNLTMSVDSLLGAGEGAGWLAGHGPIPADLAREIAGNARQLWVHRLLTDPARGVAVDIERRRKAPREFTGLLRELIATRDRECRQPFCDAPIRHADHIEPFARGGPTSAGNGQGVCARGNYLKELPGWLTWRESDGSYLRTPTGHVYRTTPPRTNGPPPRTTPVRWLRAHIVYPAP